MDALRQRFLDMGQSRNWFSEANRAADFPLLLPTATLSADSSGALQDRDTNRVTNTTSTKPSTAAPHVPAAPPAAALKIHSEPLNIAESPGQASASSPYCSPVAPIVKKKIVKSRVIESDDEASESETNIFEKLPTPTQDNNESKTTSKSVNDKVAKRKASRKSLGSILAPSNCNDFDLITNFNDEDQQEENEDEDEEVEERNVQQEGDDTDDESIENINFIDTEKLSFLAEMLSDEDIADNTLATPPPPTQQQFTTPIRTVLSTPKASSSPRRASLAHDHTECVANSPCQRIMKIVKKSNVIESDDEDEENVHSAQPLVELRRKTPLVVKKKMIRRVILSDSDESDNDVDTATNQKENGTNDAVDQIRSQIKDLTLSESESEQKDEIDDEIDDAIDDDDDDDDERDPNNEAEEVSDVEDGSTESEPEGESLDETDGDQSDVEDGSDSSLDGFIVNDDDDDDDDDKNNIASSSSPIDSSHFNQSYFLSDDDSDSDDVTIVGGSGPIIETPPSQRTQHRPILATPKRVAKNFRSNRHELTAGLYEEYNRNIFNNLLPTDLAINWCGKLNKTAGTTLCAGRNGERHASIKLAAKVVDCEERLKQTLAHEMCHAAAWLIDGNCRPPHGPLFRKWANKAMREYRMLNIATCHSYAITYKFRWKCENCSHVYGRHSNSIKPEKHRCGSCKGRLVRIGVDGTPAKVKPPNAFAVYLKQHYAMLKSQHPQDNQKELMSKISAAYKASKE